MKATIGVTTFITPNSTATITGNTLYINGRGNNSSYPAIAIAVTKWNGSTGTVNISLSTNIDATASYTPTSDLNTIDRASSGTVSITAVSTSAISGEFSFVGNKGTIVANGSFTAQRQ